MRVSVLEYIVDVVQKTWMSKFVVFQKMEKTFPKLTSTFKYLIGHCWGKTLTEFVCYFLTDLYVKCKKNLIFLYKNVNRNVKNTEKVQNKV